MDPAPINFLHVALSRVDNVNDLLSCESFNTLREYLRKVEHPQALCESPHFNKLAALSIVMGIPFLRKTFRDNMHMACKVVKYSFNYKPETFSKHLGRTKKLINKTKDPLVKTEFYICLAKALKNINYKKALSLVEKAYKIIKKDIDHQKSDLKLKFIKVLCKLDSMKAYEATRKIFHNSEAEKILALYQVLKHSRNDAKNSLSFGAEICRSQIDDLVVSGSAKISLNAKNIKICLEMDKKDSVATEMNLLFLTAESLKKFEIQSRLSILCKMYQINLDIKNMRGAVCVASRICNEIEQDSWTYENNLDEETNLFRCIENSLLVGRKLNKVQPNETKECIFAAFKSILAFRPFIPSSIYSLRRISLVCDIFKSHVAFSSDDKAKAIQFITETINGLQDEQDKVVGLSMLLTNKCLLNRTF